MSLLDPALEAALLDVQATVFGAMEIALPARPIRLLDGSGVITFDGRTFTGQDIEFGTLSAIEDLTDGSGDEAPAVSITLVPASDVAAATLAAANMQGSPIRLWLGAVNSSTGQVIGEPLLIFNGLLDVPKISSGSKGRTLEYECTSVFEDFFESDDGARLSDSFHQYIWPGELGLSFVTYVTNQIYWGLQSPDGVRK